MFFFVAPVLSQAVCFFFFVFFPRTFFLAQRLVGAVLLGSFQACAIYIPAAPDVQGNRAKSKPLLLRGGLGRGWRLGGGWFELFYCAVSRHVQCHLYTDSSGFRMFKETGPSPSHRSLGAGGDSIGSSLGGRGPPSKSLVRGRFPSLTVVTQSNSNRLAA